MSEAPTCLIELPTWLCELPTRLCAASTWLLQAFTRLCEAPARLVLAFTLPEEGAWLLFMPITGPSSYPATVAEFLAHWEDVNDALGEGNELVLAEGTALIDLADRQGDLENARDSVSDAGTDRTLARFTLNARIATLQARVVEFNARVRGDLPGSPLALALPEAFAVGEGESVVRECLRRVERLWGKVNDLSPAPAGVTIPYVLNGGYVISAFTADRTALRGAYATLTEADVDLALARAERNKLQDVIYPILKSYRQKITGMAAAHPEWVATLPRLTPEPGRTPAAVVAHGVWDATAEKAKITWSASTDADLEKYEVRAVPGDSYNTEDETVVATVLPGAAREFFSDFALGTAGLTAGFKVYVILNTGNEKGSDAVYVTRP